MKLILASFDGLFGLKGKISFAPPSLIILYGPNMAGKTNVITALRMCFWGHKIFSKNWLQKEEVILAPLTEGAVTCYFAQLNKFYKITYAFKRYEESVRRRCGLWSASLIEFDASMPPEDLHRWLETVDWEKGKEAAAPKEIKMHLEEIGIYPEIVDILLASSNIDGYVRAIEGEVCKIPEALSKQLTDIKHEANLNVGRLKKFQDHLSVLEETQRGYLDAQKQRLEEIGAQPSEIKELFTGKVAEKLDKYGGVIDERLARGIPEEEQKILRTDHALKPLRKKLEAIQETANSLRKKETFKRNLQEASRYKEALKQWREISQGLKSIPRSVWNLDTYETPDISEFEISILKDPKNVEELFKQIQKCVNQIKKAKEIASKYDIDSPKVLENTTNEQKQTLESLENPQELPPDAVPAFIYSLPKRKLPVVSISPDKYRREFAKVASTTMVHVPKSISASAKRKIDKKIEDLRQQLRELNNSLSLIQKVNEEFTKICGDIEVLPGEKETELDKKEEGVKTKILEIQNEWNRNAAVLYNFFDLGKMTFRFTDKTYEKDLSELSKKVEQCRGEIRKKIEEALAGFPKLKSKLLKRLEPANFDATTEALHKRAEELKTEREKLEKIQKWLQKEGEKIKEADRDLRCSYFLSQKIIPFAQIFYSFVSKLINLEEIVEDLGGEMERNVETAYRSVFADPTFRFAHVGKGRFIPTLANQQISRPSGSQSAAVSFGILYTLADQFKLPLIMDEAADRFDPTRLANFLELAKTVTESPEGGAKQICLAIYKTQNLKPEDLLKFNTYECIRTSNIKKEVAPISLVTK